jgi:hypothetical protein
VLDEETRRAILKLHASGNGTRSIARALKISRQSVRGVLESGQAVALPIERAGLAELQCDAILELCSRCIGLPPPPVTPVQIACLALCHSRMIYFQAYPRFSLFECMSFLTAAGFGGAAEVCMIDNAHLVEATQDCAPPSADPKPSE